MDRRFLTVLGVSLLFALVVSGIFWQVTAKAGASTGPREAPADMKDVVVALKALPLGTTIKPADVKVVRMPLEQFPKGAFSKVEEVVDRPVTAVILAEEAVLEGRLAARGSGLGLAPIIPVGMRAVSVRVNDEANVAGYVLPGMRVDVLVTGRPPEGETTVTTTVLQNLQVLSAGTTLEAAPNGTAINAPTVTLLVTPEQAETLTLAGSEGRLRLILRNGSDQGIEATRGMNARQLYAKQGGAPTPPPSAAPVARPRPRPVVVMAAPPVPLPPAPPPVPVTSEVVIYRGPQKSVETVAPARPGEARAN